MIWISFSFCLCEMMSSVDFWQWLQSGLNNMINTALLDGRLSFVKTVMLSLNKNFAGGNVGNRLKGGVVVSICEIAFTVKNKLNINNKYFTLYFEQNKIMKIKKKI